MDKKLLDFIRELSNADSKTLSQKTLKACEEVGELAKVVLPFEDAFACKHRFVDRRAILEEVADVMLTVMSVAHHLGFEDNDLDEMIKEKALYWAELQSRDRDAKFPIPYEIHVTVRSSEIEAFKIACLAANVKPILLNLQNCNGITVMQELMTSSIFMGNNSSVYAEMQRISNTLQSHNFTILREKIETVPWHPAAPSSKHSEPKMPLNCYFESHLVIVTAEADLPKLRELVTQHDCHLSNNVFKRIDSEHFKIMSTYRKYDGSFEDFKNSVEMIKKSIVSAGFEVEKIIVEFSVYDSRVSHDTSWLKV